MSKGPPQLPSNPFSRPDTLAAPRSAHGGFSDGIKVDTPEHEESAMKKWSHRPA